MDSRVEGEAAVSTTPGEHWREPRHEPLPSGGGLLGDWLVLIVVALVCLWLWLVVRGCVVVGVWLWLLVAVLFGYS